MQDARITRRLRFGSSPRSPRSPMSRRTGRAIRRLGLGIVVLVAPATPALAQETGYRAEGMLCERPSGFATGVRARTPQGPTVSVGADHDVGALPAFAVADVGAAGAGA